jgi:glutamine synthetase
MSFVLHYIWYDINDNFRSKTKVFDGKINDINDVPEWNYDGSSTGQALGKNSEIILKPVFMCKDPFRKNLNSYLVLCNTKNRDNALEIFIKYKDTKPWFGLEQEYFIIDNNTNKPFGFSDNIVVSSNNIGVGTTCVEKQCFSIHDYCLFSSKKGNYYCGIGSKYAIKRNISELHLEHCLYAGLKISGINAEVAPAQWEYQIGPVESIEACDQLLMSRFILLYIAELDNCNISFHPKLLDNYNGSGCHTNFSNHNIRTLGISEINKAMEKLEENHFLHMENYGKFNELRMTGIHETSSFHKFSWGIGDRSCSIRIPTDISKNPYFEDRRPASNMDPYVVCSLIVKTIN